MPVGNVPLVGYALKLLAYHGITDVIVNLHHLPKPIRDYLGSGKRYGVNITYSHEPELLGTGGGLKKMHEVLSEDTFVVVNSDTISDVDLTGALDAHRRSGALATMVLREDPQQDEFGQIEVDSQHRIWRILGHGTVPSGISLHPYMFAGVHILDPRFLEYIPPDVNTCINRYAYLKALNNDETLNSFLATGYWADAGTPERYYQANVDALDRRMILPHADPLDGFAVTPKKEVPDVVRMGEGVDLGTSARIVPPVVVGDHVRVGEQASLGPYSVIGARCSIGKGAAVSNAVLLSGSKVDAGARVHRAIVGKRAVVQLDAPPDASADQPKA